MYPLSRLQDSTVIATWLQAGHTSGVYARMTTILWQIGYVEASEPKIRRRLKTALKRKRLIPARPSLRDYQRAFARAGSLQGEELN